MTAICVQIITEPDEHNAFLVFSIPKSELNQHAGPVMLNEFRIEAVTKPVAGCSVDLTRAVPVTAVDDGPHVQEPTLPDPMHATPPYRPGPNGHVLDLYGATVLWCGPWAGCPARYSERSVEDAIGDKPNFVCPSCGCLGRRMEEAPPEACGLPPG